MMSAIYAGMMLLWFWVRPIVTLFMSTHMRTTRILQYRSASRTQCWSSKRCLSKPFESSAVWM